MVETLLTLLETSQPAALLRGSLWLYPAVNAGHILGIALLVGSIVPMDLKLLGAWPATPVAPLLRVLSGTVAVGIALTLICGALLFISRASAYAGSTIFLTKMGIVCLGLLNGLVMRMVLSPKRQPQWLLQNSRPPWPLRLAALLSLGCWLTALVLGRLIAYVR